MTRRNLVWAAAFAAVLRDLGHGQQRTTQRADGTRETTTIDARAAAREWADEAARAAEGCER